MVFKRGFFLDLSNGEAEQPAATVAPVKAAPEAPAKAQTQQAAPADVAPATTAAAAPAPTKTAESSSSAPSLTTAEAIAAELAAAQASRPAPRAVTFAPDCVTAGGALSRPRRRSGADLAGFREMARGMMGN